MLIFCALTTVIVLIVKEREAGITALIKPLRHGPVHIVAAKSAAVLICVIFTGALWRLVRVGRSLTPRAVAERIYRLQSADKRRDCIGAYFRREDRRRIPVHAYFPVFLHRVLLGLRVYRGSGNCGG